MREVISMTFEEYKVFYKANYDKFDCCTYNYKEKTVTVFWKRGVDR